VNQYNAGGENFQTKTGDDNTNFFGGTHYHVPEQSVSVLYDIPSELGSQTFVGREEELTQLHNLLQDTNRVAIAAATGMGGVGKTELAWQYAVQRRGSYPAGIWWLFVREQSLAMQVLDKARRMQIALPDGLAGEALVRFCYDQWAARTEGNGLLVLDDLADYASVRSLLPQNPRLKVLMTSRTEFGSPVRCLALAVLKPDKALELLQKLVGEARIEAEQGEAEALCSWLGYLPLGIELVGRYLATKPDLSLAEMQRRLNDQRLNARALKLPEDLRGNARPYENLTAAFELSWRELPESAQQLACCLSLFALAPIDWSLVPGCLPDCDAETLEDLRDNWLVKLHLLERTESHTYQIHQLLRQFFAAECAMRSDVVTLQTAFAVTLTEIAKTIPQTVTLSDVARVKEAIPHLEIATDYAVHLPEDDQITSFIGLTWFYQGQSLWQSAEQWSKTCLNHAEQQLRADHPSIATSLNNLAKLYHDQGQYSEAEPLFVRAIEIREQQLGAEHPDVASSLHNLAGLYYAQGRYSEAEAYYLRALEIWERHLGAMHPNVAQNFNNLALLYYAQGRYGEAEAYYLRALEIWERQLEVVRPLVATSLNNLAGLYYAQGRYGEAEPRYLRALEIREQQLGVEHPDVAQSLNNLALLYYAQRKYSEAEPLLLRALKIWERHLGVVHPLVATSLNNLAEFYRVQGQYSKAEPRYLRALEICEQRLGIKHPLFATNLNNLALLYYAQRKYSEAESLLLRALEIREQQLGVNHPDIATNLNNLAGLYNFQGYYSKAEPLYLRAAQIVGARLGAEHPDTQTVFKNLKEFLRQTIAANRTAELSANPLTQQLLQALQTEAE
jgi:tetratricopeptide (TPR) repeat protein